MISSIGNAAAAALVPRPHEAAPGALPQDGARGRPESANPGTARPGGGGPTGPLLDPATVVALQEHGQGDEARQEAGERDSTSAAAADAAPAPTEPAAGPAANLSAEEKREVQQLKRADAEVRRHEAAHASAGGAFTGSPSYTYQTGPDGKRYAVGGEVSIDASPVAGDPEATIAKMRTVQRAANAPADPSGQGRAVAAAAARTESQARAELAAARREERGDALGGEAPEPNGAKVFEAPFGRDAGKAAPISRPASQDDTASQGVIAEPSPFDPSFRSQTDGRPGGVIQIATQRYGAAASLVGTDDSNRLAPFQATGTATPRIELFA